MFFERSSRNVKFDSYNFLCDLSLFKPNIDLISYADDKTPFSMGGSPELEVINEIKGVAVSITLWF